MLDFLEQANLFLVALDDERQWYRYHYLFAEALQQTAPTLLPELHRRASRWYELQGFYAAAVSHALAAPALEEAARLIEQRTWSFMVGNQLQTLCGWLHVLPETLVLAHPSLGLLYALALMYTNHWQEASTRLLAIEREVGLGEDTQEERDLLARLSGDLEGYMAMAQRALDLLPGTDTALLTRVLRVGALLGVAHAYLVSGDVTSESEQLLAGTIGFARASLDYQLLIPRGLILLARLQGLQGGSSRLPLPMKRSCNWSRGQRKYRSWPIALPAACPSSRGSRCFPGKYHPGITPFGYCLVPLLSATLLRETGVTLRQAVNTLRRRNLQCL